MNEQPNPIETEFQDALAKQYATEEVEVWTGACSIRIFLPALLAGLIISAALYAIARVKGADDDNDFLRYTLEGLILLGWIILLGFAGYRVLGTEYMLTNKRLYCRRGFGHPGREGVDLTSFLDVRVAQSSLERWLRAGRISLSVALATGTPCVLYGVPDPERVANMIRKQIRAAHPVRQ
jgi:hypothetical protein